MEAWLVSHCMSLVDHQLWSHILLYFLWWDTAASQESVINHCSTGCGMYWLATQTVCYKVVISSKYKYPHFYWVPSTVDSAFYSRPMGNPGKPCMHKQRIPFLQPHTNIVTYCVCSTVESPQTLLSGPLLLGPLLSLSGLWKEKKGTTNTCCHMYNATHIVWLTIDIIYLTLALLLQL